MDSHFGEHITIDAYGGDRDLLNDKAYILNFLKELPLTLGMKILTEPEIEYAEGNDKKDPGGWSGFVMIEESHISIHTFPAKGFFSADVYTCKNGMDLEQIKKIFSEKFKTEDLETNFVIRGKKYMELT